MAMQNPYSKYKEQSIFTATNEELILMLYDGALKFCNQAITAIENKEFEKAHNLLIKVQDIIREFQIVLDHKYEISKSFDSTYDYMFRRAVEANIKKDISIVEEVRGYLREMRETWKEAMALAKAKR